MERLALYKARVVAGVVEIEQGGEFLPADDIILQSAGGADSAGYAVIGEAIALYFVNTQGDTQVLIDKVIAVIDETITIANQLVVKTPSAPPVVLDPVAAANLEIIKTELTEFKLV